MGSPVKIIANVHRLTTSFVLGYHGCSKATAERVLSGKQFQPSDNEYDWLGPGVYFWQSNPRRALQFAQEKRKRDGADWKCALVGAVIDPGLCLDLSTDAGIDHVRAAYDVLLDTSKEGGIELPVNSGGNDLLVRKLDCAVIRMLHDIRATGNLEAIDTIFGTFVEGKRLYQNSGFFEKTHVQVCVCNPQRIRGIFRVPEADLN